MKEEELIKQKMKETKKQLKENNMGGNIGILYGIILSILQVLSSFIISKDTQWFVVIITGYMIIVTYIIKNIQIILPIPKEETKKKMLTSYIYTNPIMFIGICFYRQMGFWSLVIGFIYFILMCICLNSDGLDKTNRELSKLDDLSQKAVIIEYKKMRIIATILAIIGGVFASFLGRAFTIDSKTFPIIYMVLIVSAFIGIGDFIVYIILKFISKRKEKVLNKAFNLKMGEMTKDYIYDKIYNTHILYNLSIEYYKQLSIFVTIVFSLILLKFNIYSIVLTNMIYLIINTAMTLDKGHIHITPPEKVASIYNATGTKTGEIKYR